MEQRIKIIWMLSLAAMLLIIAGQGYWLWNQYRYKNEDHGGANSKVMAMMDDVKEHVRDWNDEGCVADYLTRILNKDAFDRSGLIYGPASSAALWRPT